MENLLVNHAAAGEAGSRNDDHLQGHVVVEPVLLAPPSHYQQHQAEDFAVGAHHVPGFERNRMGARCVPA